MSKFTNQLLYSVILALLLLLVACNGNSSIKQDDFIGFWAVPDVQCPTTFVTIEKEGSNYVAEMTQLGRREEKFLVVYEDGILKGKYFTLTLNDKGELVIYENGNDSRYERLSNEERAEIFEPLEDIENGIIGTWKSQGSTGLLILNEDGTFKYGADSGTYSINKNDNTISFDRDRVSIFGMSPSEVSVTGCILVLNIVGSSYSRVHGVDELFIRNLGEYEQLITDFTQAIELDPNNADAYYNRGSAYVGLNDYKQAIGDYTKAINLAPNSVIAGKAYHNRGVVYYHLGNHEKALNDFTQALSNLEQALTQGDNSDETVRELAAVNGNMGKYYFTLGQELGQKEHFQEALTFLEQASNLAPSNVIYHNLRAQIHYILGDYDTAIDVLQVSLSVDSKDPATWLQLGDTYAAKADVDKALEAHKEAILLNPSSFADANYDNRLNFYLASQRSDDLIDAFEEYIANHSAASQRIPLWAIGHIYLRAGNLEKANQYFQQAIDKGYTNAKSLTGLGDAYLAQEKYEQAEAAYQKALQLKKPNNAQIYSSLGYIYARTERLPEAIEANSKVLESLPDDFDSHKNLAILYQQLGQIDQALVHAEVALPIVPEGSKADIEAFINQLKNLQSTP